jgi:hypothetical protein
VDLASEGSGEDFISPFTVAQTPFHPNTASPFSSLDNETFTKAPDSSPLIRQPDQNAVVMQQLLAMLNKSTQQKSLTQTLGELIAVLTPVIPLIQSLLTRQKPLDAFEIQRMLDDKENIIRSRIIDERDKEEERIKRLVDEKVEYAGIGGGGGEKSIVGELADLLKTVPDLLKPIMPQRQQQYPQQPQRRALPQQQVVQPEPQEPLKVEVLPPQKEEKPLPVVNSLTPTVDNVPYEELNEDEKYVFQTIVEAVTANIEPRDALKRIPAKEKRLFLKVDGAKLVSVAKKMIKLDDATWSYTDEWVKTFYKVLKSDADISNRGQKKQKV